MRTKYLLILMAAVLFSCKKEKSIISEPLPPNATTTAVLLKDVEITNLPSPYYHFEYNADSSVSHVSFASGFKNYAVKYTTGRISEMVNEISGLEEKLQYVYDNAGRVIAVNCFDLTGAVYIKVFFTYDGKKLVKLERHRKLGVDFLINKTLSFDYYSDGNLKELTDYRPAINGVQNESTTIDRFEQYGNSVNVDGFSLIHNDFFDHLVFLPGVQFQKNNPTKEIFTSNELNYDVTYTYRYNEKNLPLTKYGEMTITSGSNAGQKFQTKSIYSYY